MYSIYVCRQRTNCCVWMRKSCRFVVCCILWPAFFCHFILINTHLWSEARIRVHAIENWPNSRNSGWIYVHYVQKAQGAIFAIKFSKPFSIRDRLERFMRRYTLCHRASHLISGWDYKNARSIRFNLVCTQTAAGSNQNLLAMVRRFSYISFFNTFCDFFLFRESLAMIFELKIVFVNPNNDPPSTWNTWNGKKIWIFWILK